jgi:peptidase M28-like protein
MRIAALAILAASLLTLAGGARSAPPEPAPPGPSARDPRIEEILGRISAERIRSRIERLAAFGTRHTLSDTTNETRGIGAARRWIQAELERISKDNGGRLKVSLDSYVQEPTRRVARPTEIVDVVATLPGTQPESAGRIYVVSGHYDSRATDVEDAASDAPGANDDASGTAVVLELAEAMSHSELDATVVFMAVAGEEQGLFGSSHYAKAAKEAGRTIQGMITNDIVGNTEGTGGGRDNRSVRLFSEGIPALDSPLAARLRSVGGENDSPSRQLARAIREAAALYLPDFDVHLVFRTDRYLRGGDHLPFLEQGYPAVRMTEPVENFDRQHQNVRQENGVAYGDVVEKVDFDYVARVARVNAAALASLALAPAPPAETQIDASKLENDTTLRWKASTAPDVAGYEVLWRETTAALWEHALYVGNVTSATLPLSKDNLHFGVRAVDRDGHRSEAAFPLPPPRP